MFWFDLYYVFILIMMVVVFGMGIFWLYIYTSNRKSINKKNRKLSFFPKISIIIPAYNEEKHIGTALKSIFSSNYPRKKMEVMVIDDGSKDNTVKIANKFPVRIVKHKKNMGKIFALNNGIRKAKNEVIVTTDADTILRKNTIGLLVQSFTDPKVGAVGGIYKAIRRYSFKKNPFKYLLERLQSLEYFGFSLIRKEQEVLNSILVIPGSVAAYRKSALKKVGGFDYDTVIEDYDITLKMHKAGYKVRCDKNAVAWVLAPQTIKSLVRQRTRWYRGGLQVLKKHFDIMHTRVGAVTFVWGFEIMNMLLQVVVFFMALIHLSGRIATNTLIDFLITLKYWAVSLFSLKFGLLSGLVLIGLFLFTIGTINTAISIKIHGSSMKKMLLIPFMMFYSSFLALIFIKSFFQEIFGKKIQFIGSMKAES